ncbi:hypothetical protein RIVM261_038470 [Rivularia sp. IAM M-261]|nr:hypothetical protein CAL7716_077510 [Calothrix sp. PCC 7716]GJD18891.1 hypothetical protein RIVM261_038470 [Rivularia sp. IAM M-261]
MHDNNNDLSNRNNKFYLNFTQIGKIILVDNEKYFKCESDGLVFPIKIKGDYRSQDTDVIDKLGYFSIIPICDSSGKIIFYHIIELNKKAKSEVFIIQARVKQTIRTGAVELLLNVAGNTNIAIPVQTNNKFKMTSNQIYLCQGYRENDKIYISNYALIPEVEETTVVEQSNTNVNKYAEIVASNQDGILIYIPASEIETAQWRPTTDKKYKLVTLPDGIKIINT